MLCVSNLYPSLQGRQCFLQILKLILLFTILSKYCLFFFVTPILRKYVWERESANSNTSHSKSKTSFTLQNYWYTDRFDYSELHIYRYMYSPTVPSKNNGKGREKKGSKEKGEANRGGVYLKYLFNLFCLHET